VSSEVNPFPPEDADRHQIWELLVRRDSDFFLSGDWALVAQDYDYSSFFGIGTGLSLDPAGWRLEYSTVEAYRDAAIAGRLDPNEFGEPLRAAWLRCQSLERVDVSGDLALAHKRIEGSMRRKSGDPLQLGWRSVFHLKRVDAAWKIAGFTGYLPL